MKRFITLALAALMIFTAASCGKSEELDPEIAYIVELIEDEDYDMAIHVIEGLRDQNGGSRPSKRDEDEEEGKSSGNSSNKLSGAESQQPGQDVQPQPDGPQPYENSREAIRDGDGWLFEMDIVNPAEMPVTIQFLEVNDRVDGTSVTTLHFEGDELRQMLPELYLEPHSGYGWAERVSDSAIRSDVTARDYLFYCTADDGTEVIFVWYFFMEDSGSAPVQEQPPQNTPAAVNPDGSLSPILNGSDWLFEMTVTNREDRPMRLWAMDIQDFKNGQDLGTSIFEGDVLKDVGLGDVILQPGDPFTWRDGHPVTDRFDARLYRFHFTDDNGGGFTEAFYFTTANATPRQQPTGGRVSDYAGDPAKDLMTLRHGADFEVEVAPGVYWVPAVSLGESRYTNGQVYDMLPAAPEEKAELIGTLYEALQFYQIGNFTASDDNQRIPENGVNWEHHKPGYYAVLTNTGCCATDSNWLNYLLAGDYDEVGYIATSQPDGSGHIYNCIYEDGWYYIIDLTHYRHSDYNTAVENGDLNGYHRSDFILGNIHKTRDIHHYVDYVQDAFNDPPGLMFMYTADNCMAVDSIDRGQGVDVVYERRSGVEVTVIFDNTRDRLNFVYADTQPQNRGDWDSLPPWDFMQP